MEYKEIVSVTGEAGLFQLLSSKSDGAIVRSLDGKTTRFVPSRNHNFTPLESIEVFTTGENVPLSEVFKTMKEKEAAVPVIEAGKDAAAIKEYFEKVYPELDGARVYMSDMKKMLKWYPILKENELLKFEDVVNQAEEEEKEPEEQEKEPEEKEKAVKEKKQPKAAPKPKAKSGDGAEAKEKKSPTRKSPAKKKAAAKKTDGDKS